MSTKEIIEKKVSSLGGIKENPSCKEAFNKTDNSVQFSDIEKKYGTIVPLFYKDIYDLYGPFSFVKSIKTKCLDKNPVQNEKGLVSVDYFYSIEPNLGCSMDSVIRMHPEFLKSKLLPICDGEPGDLICIDLSKERYESVFYWFHEAEKGKELILIAKSVHDFWIDLQVQEEEPPDEEIMKNIEVKMSPKLLEMLRKSGYGPKG